MSTVTGNASTRTLSLPKQVAAAGGISAWNKRNPEKARQWAMVEDMCKATTVRIFVHHQTQPILLTPLMRRGFLV